jgi:hypothetical protein
MRTKVDAPDGPRPLAVRRLHAPPVADRELEWFFNAAEGDMGNRSNFCRAMGRNQLDADRGTPEDFAEAAHSYRSIRGWLKSIPDRDAGILQCAYEPRRWPRRLREDLGKLTGLVVRLTCACDPWPDDLKARELIEMTRAGWLESQPGEDRSDVSIVKLRREAEVLFAHAIHGYDRARGARPSVLGPWCSK